MQGYDYDPFQKARRYSFGCLSIVVVGIAAAAYWTWNFDPNIGSFANRYRELQRVYSRLQDELDAATVALEPEKRISGRVYCFDDLRKLDALPEKGRHSHDPDPRGTRYDYTRLILRANHAPIKDMENAETLIWVRWDSESTVTYAFYDRKRKVIFLSKSFVGVFDSREWTTFNRKTGIPSTHRWSGFVMPMDEINAWLESVLPLPAES